MMGKKIWLFAALWLISVGCSSEGEIYMTEVNNLWGKNDAKKIEFEIKDAQSPKNLIFVIRNNNEYPYNNLFLISTIKGEKNKVLKTDTLQYILAKPNGEWYGSGIGDVKEIFVQYKNEYKFPANGKYKVELKHGMRTDQLKGIEDIGIKIENIKTTTP
jgi:gliding motility lipoprotein gldH homolog